eukprot:TRINITY_DN257_c0_g1_i2.p1 TRINITY_DN257_c0_g1~~TRINITY_DN257_c0_g1_i2.p1  ORF type:complete len:207 (+),score=40.49 TRINITY_DN257_c0_g1_i2:300-920(+)
MGAKCSKGSKPTGGGADDPIKIRNNTNTSDNTEDGNFHLQKILLIGDQNVGKTSLIIRYSDGTYQNSVSQSIGVDFKVRTIKVDGKVVKLQMWDTAGQEQFRTISSSYYRGADGIILAYAVNDLTSFENLKRQWMSEVERYACETAAKIVVGCKSDLAADRKVAQEDVKAWADELNIPCVELSAKTGNDEEIAAPFMKLARLILDT